MSALRLAPKRVPEVVMNQLLADPSAAGPVLLVVDDREENLVAMDALLGDGTWQVRTVDSVEAALRCMMT